MLKWNPIPMSSPADDSDMPHSICSILLCQNSHLQNEDNLRSRLRSCDKQP